MRQNLDDKADEAEKEWRRELLNLFSQAGKCASNERCIGNTFYTSGQEFIGADKRKYCCEECYENHRQRIKNY